MAGSQPEENGSFLFSTEAVSATEIFFIDRNNGWLVGSVGIIAHTTDGGKSWSLQERVVSRAFNRLQFVDINHGWIGAGGWAFLRTTDGGVNWSFSSGVVSGFDFLDYLNGFGMNRDYVLKTSDGGVTWHEVAECSPYLAGFDFVDLEKAWGAMLIRQPFFDSLFSWIVHTTDGGKTWTAQTEVFRGDWLGDLTMVDEHYGWVGKGLNTILHTSNGGETWKEQLTPALKGHIFDICFIDREHGWAVAEHGQILRTKNGGNPITK